MIKVLENKVESDVTNPLVTFVVLAYNEEKYIREAVEGALAQTYSPLEIILSDDCSTDNTFSIMQAMAKKYRGPHRIVLNRNDKNLGICDHVNPLWARAKGKWIIHSDGDDISRHDRTERVMQVVLADPEIKLVLSYLNVIDTQGSHLRTYTLQDFTNDDDNAKLYSWNIASRISNMAPHLHGASMAYSREVIDDFAPLPSDCIYGDSMIGFRAELLGKGVLIRESLVSYRMHDSQVTNYYDYDIATNYSKRIRRHFDFVKTRRQDVEDFNALQHSNNITFDAASIARIDAWLKRRLNFFVCYYKALSKPWPLRLIYLVPVLFRSFDFVKTDRDMIFQCVLPKPIYFFLKSRISRY